MKFSRLTLVLSSLAIGQVMAHPVQWFPSSEEIEMLEKRQGPADLIALAAGVFAQIAGGSAGTVVAADIANAFATAFNPNDKAPFQNSDNCRISFHTKGGSNCYAKTTPASKSGNSSTDANTHDNNWNVCPWINPASTAPPIQYFDDPGIGKYSIQFTATDTVAWSGIKNTATCAAQGLCNPRLTFYRDNFNLIIDSWLADDESNTGIVDGLCQDGWDEVENQFTANGDLLGDNCAVPCWNQMELPDHNDG